MQLVQFPQAIHSCQHNLLKAGQLVRQLQANLDRLSAKIDSEVAFDLELKNEAQRKARRIALTETPEYAKAMELLQVAKDRLTEMEIDHQLLLNQFAVLKLRKWESIVQKEIQTRLLG